jgi:hypothetical protein
LHRKVFIFLSNFELCPLLGKHNCELLEKRGKLSVKDMFPDAPEMIYMGPLGLPYTEVNSAPFRVLATIVLIVGRMESRGALHARRTYGRGSAL